jgi:Zn-dependent metalloprotease
MYRIPIISFLLVLYIFVNAQSDQRALFQKTQNFKAPISETVDLFIDKFHGELGLNSPQDLKKTRSFGAKNGWVRNRYTQTYKGLDVLGSSYILHEKNGSVEKSTGTIYPLINISIIPQLQVAQATQALKDQIINSIDLGKYSPLEVYNTIEILDKRLCVMDKAYPNFSGRYMLVYEIDARYETDAYQKFRYLLDANTGQLLDQYTEICHIGEEGIALTRYYGEQNITTTSTAQGRFRLFDDTRKVHTVNGNERNNNLTFGYEYFEDDDNYWDNANENLDEVAGDAHYCTAAYHDYMLENFGWKGVDGVGGDLVSVVHVNGRFYLNAYWDGTATYYGNGLCADYGPLTSLDVVGHEFAHGFTEFTSGLIYRNESGALNESISDILGKALEHEYDPDNFNWDIGGRFTTGDALPFRSMSDPNERNDPKYYRGTFWQNGLGDNGGVHSNSGVYNFWYYLLVEGAAGENEAGVNYNVNAIGFEKATDIVFGTQVAYFTPSSNYVEAFKRTLEYTTDTYGEGSLEYTAVSEAWKAVGLSEDVSFVQLSGDFLEEVFISTLCPDDCFPVEIVLTNSGLDILEAGTEVKLKYFLSNVETATESFNLTETFAPGDSVWYTFDREICFNVDGEVGQQNSVRVEYAVGAETDFQRIGTHFINYNGGEGKDLELERAEYTTEVCEETQHRLALYYSISGCDVIEAGQTIELIQSINGVEQSNDIAVNFPISPSVTYILVRSLSLTMPLEQQNILRTELRFPEDLETSNNFIDQDYNVYEVMEEGAMENFGVFEVDASRYLSINDLSRTKHEVVNYNGNRKLAVSINQPSTNVRNCPDPEDIFSDYFFKNEISGCFDVTGINDPVLRFDVIPYYSNQVEGLTIDRTAMFKVFLQAASNSSIEIEAFPVEIDLEEGVEHAMEYDIPEDTGSFVISSACMIGNDFAVESGLYDEIDAFIYDNIRIESRSTTSAEDLIDAEALQVYPNPASDVINFNYKSEGTYNLSIYTIDGRIVDYVTERSNTYSWNVPVDFSGLIMYKIEDSAGKSAVGKIVVH